MYEVIIILMLIVMITINKIFLKNWFNPANIMAVMWAVFIIGALIAFNNRIEWKYISFIWIILACIFFSFGNILGASKNKLQNKIFLKANNSDVLSDRSWQFIIICILIGLIRVFIELYINGFNISSFLDIDSLISMNTTIAQERYSGGGTKTNFIMQILLIFLYALPLCSGYGFVYSEKKSQKRICIFSFVPILLSMLMTNGKAGVVASFMLWISGYIVAYLNRFKKIPKFKIRSIGKFVLSIFCLIVLLYLSMMFRIGSLNKEVFDVVGQKFINYALGQMYAFDYWFTQHIFISEYTLGANTFMSIFDLLGIITKQQGIYVEPIYISGYLYTNIYTSFRGIISDFGVIGGLISIGVWGIISGISYKIVLTNRRSIIAKVTLVATYFFIFHSFLVSPWSYLSYVLAFVVFGYYLYISNDK